MRFSKFHGAGNDFVMVADLDARMGAPGTLPSDLVAALCDRHKGVGADGVIRVLANIDGAERYMDYYNSDGSVAEMCGNGIRCLVLHEQRAGRLDEGDHKIGTLGRAVLVRSAGTARYTVDMGPATIEPMLVTLDGVTYAGSNVSMSNPHFVLFVDTIGRALDDATVLGLGSRLEVHPDFPNKTNVEFVQIVDATHVKMRVWERGCGETLACGSGICATAVAASTLERTGPHIRVTQPGGELEVECEPGGHVWLTGPAEEVFTGEIDADWLAARGLDKHAALVA